VLLTYAARCETVYNVRSVAVRVTALSSQRYIIVTGILRANYARGCIRYITANVCIAITVVIRIVEVSIVHVVAVVSTARTVDLNSK
jgi:hypothetical protein